MKFEFVVEMDLVQIGTNEFFAKVRIRCDHRVVMVDEDQIIEVKE